MNVFEMSAKVIYIRLVEEGGFEGAGAVSILSSNLVALAVGFCLPLPCDTSVKPSKSSPFRGVT